MCIIVIKKKGIEIPSWDILKNCFYNNEDGAGFMYNKNGVVYIKKGFMKWEDFKDALQDTIDELGRNVINTGMVFHFRITTQGDTNPMNCHPFPISCKNNDLQQTYIQTNLGITHNGIIDLTTEHYYIGMPYSSKDAGLSDTQLFIRDYLYNIYKISNEFYKSQEAMDLIKRLIKSKMCFLNGDGNICPIDDLIEDKKIFFSNDKNKKLYARYSTCYDDYDNYDRWKNTYNNHHKNNRRSGSIWWKAEDTEVVSDTINIMPLVDMTYYSIADEWDSLQDGEVFGIDDRHNLYMIDLDGCSVIDMGVEYDYLFSEEGLPVTFNPDNAKAMKLIV